MEEKVEEELVVDEGDFFLDINDETIIYEIESFDNRKQPEDKRMKVHIKPLSGKDLSQISSLIKHDITKYKKEHPDEERDFVELYEMFNDKREFEYRISKLENFKFKLNGEIKEFVTPLELFCFESNKIAKITREIKAYLFQLDLLDLKKLTIAFLLWVEGNADYKDNPLTRERVHMVSFGKKAYSFKKKDIPKFTTSYFWEWVKLWKWWKKDRLPYNKGWMEHPWKVIRVIELFDALYEDNERKRQKQRADEQRR